MSGFTFTSVSQHNCAVCKTRVEVSILPDRSPGLSGCSERDCEYLSPNDHVVIDKTIPQIPPNQARRPSTRTSTSRPNIRSRPGKGSRSIKPSKPRKPR